jgi:hypothetical protein
MAALKVNSAIVSTTPRNELVFSIFGSPSTVTERDAQRFIIVLASFGILGFHSLE